MSGSGVFLKQGDGFESDGVGSALRSGWGGLSGRHTPAGPSGSRGTQLSEGRELPGYVHPEEDCVQSPVRLELSRAGGMGAAGRQRRDGGQRECPVSANTPVTLPQVPGDHSLRSTA